MNWNTSNHAQREDDTNVARKHGELSNRWWPSSASRAGLAIVVLAAGAGLYVPTGSTHAAGDQVEDADSPLYDPGPPWAPDYGLMCEILERYGNAQTELCPQEPVTSISGPQ